MNDHLMQKARKSGLFVYQELKYHFLNLVYPRVCTGCHRVDTNWCDNCHAQLTASPCMAESTTQSNLTEIISTADHSGIIRDAIHAMKYNGAQHLGNAFAQRMTQVIPTNWHIDCIVPVPLHPARFRQRGYNQSEAIAHALGLLLDCPMHPTALTRTRETASQVTKSQDERHLNVKDAFTGSALLLSYKTVLLIDDVMTTGATLQACADSAISAGARKVYGLTVSRARSHNL